MNASSGSELKLSGTLEDVSQVELPHSFSGTLGGLAINTNAQVGMQPEPLSTPSATADTPSWGSFTGDVLAPLAPEADTEAKSEPEPRYLTALRNVRDGLIASTNSIEDALVRDKLEAFADGLEAKFKTAAEKYPEIYAHRIEDFQEARKEWQAETERQTAKIISPSVSKHAGQRLNTSLLSIILNPQLGRQTNTVISKAAADATQEIKAKIELSSDEWDTKLKEAAIPEVRDDLEPQILEKAVAVLSSNINKILRRQPAPTAEELDDKLRDIATRNYGINTAVFKILTESGYHQDGDLRKKRQEFFTVIAQQTAYDHTDKLIEEVFLPKKRKVPSTSLFEILPADPRNPYDLEIDQAIAAYLEANPHSTTKEIRRYMAKELHPDRTGDGVLFSRFTERYRDPVKRS